MASIIKNQILKHLSRFTKNLSANNIHLDTFKGEGTLKCLELDENVLTELLELPVWMKLTNAWCNSVAFSVQWTKLKSVPIHLTLDQVTIEIETCEELRSASVQGLSSYMQAPGKYSFIHKVIDGISIAVNTTEIIFRSPAFVASVTMLKILVESKTPEWKKDDLQKTRLKDVDRGQILIFKELQWQNVRIEAKSITEKDLPPLRLITDKASCRITIKKRLADCFVVGSRLVLNLDTALWVLTDSQLKAALHFLDSLSGLIQKSSEVTRKKTAARKLEELPEYRAQLAQQARVDTTSNTKSMYFARHDVIETSYHFLSNNIDFHLSDDPDGLSHPDLKGGGSLQVNLIGFKVDFYPYHLAVGDRKHWPKYNEGDSPHTQWLNSALTGFKSALLDIIESPKNHHSPLERTSNNIPPGLISGDINKVPTSSNSKIKAYLKDQFAKLMTTCIILRIADFNVHKVPFKRRSNSVSQAFIKGDKEFHKFPAEMATVHVEFTYFYYPGDIAFPLPSPKFYVHANPICVYFDVLTVIWLNTFFLNLHQSLLTTETANQESAAALIYFDVIVEAIMARMVFESSQETSGQRDRPKSLHFHVSRLSLTNNRSPDYGSARADLAKCIHTYQLGSLFYGVDFPSSATDFHIITEKFLDHVECKDNVREPPQLATKSDSIEDILQVLKQDLLWTEAKDVWCVRLDPVWGDFYGVRAIGVNKPVPFLDAVPVTLWVHTKSLLPQNGPVSSSSEDRIADIHAMACVSSLVSVQINHYQLLFLMRLAEDFGELTTFLAIDTKRITNEAGSIIMGAILPQLEVTFVMQSQQPGKESTSGGDLESSVVPDSSSLVDDGTAVSSSTANVHWNSFHNNTQVNGFSRDFDLKLGYSKDKVSSDFQPSRLEEISNLVKEVTSSREPTKNILKKQGSSFFSTPVKSGDSPGTKKNLMSDNNISKKWSNLMESFKQTPIEDLSDSVSIRSDSDNSDSYIFLKANDKDGFADDQFNFGADCKVEVACEALDDDDDITPLTTPPSERDSLASSYKRKDLISVATFKLGEVEFLQQSEGFHSAIKIQVTNIAVDECPSIPWDEFQVKFKNKFTTRSRDWIEIERQPGGQPCVKLRLNHEIKRHNIEKWSKSLAHQWASDYLILRLTNINLTISASTLAGISDVVEDEVVPQPLPLELDIENIKLHLIEERALSNISSPEPVPVDLLVCRLRIRRGADGMFCIEPFDAKNCTKILNSASTLSNSLSDENMAKMSEMKREMEQLRRRLAAMESLNEENHQLRKYQEENHTLRAQLNCTQQEVMTLLEDKRKLLERLESYQVGNGTESSFSKR
nr:PREDICTED: UHRF1-binding protein 1-like [Bemisia tabaci]